MYYDPRSQSRRPLTHYIVKIHGRDYMIVNGKSYMIIEINGMPHMIANDTSYMIINGNPHMIIDGRPCEVCFVPNEQGRTEILFVNRRLTRNCLSACLVGHR